MMRSVIGRALFVALGAGAAVVMSWRVQTARVRSESGASTAQAASCSASGDNARPTDVDRRLTRLEARLAEAASERRHLGEQVAALAAQLAAHPTGADVARAAAHPTPASQAPVNPATTPSGPDVNLGSPMERALTAAGLDPATAADIKRRLDESTMAEMYLRDQATREGWIDSPRFNEEMAAIDAQRTPLREQIGDDAYDRYLFALGQANRVRVEDVLSDSPAAAAGLQAGDLILRYGDDRLFAPNELVDETRSGTPGEAVQLEIIRDGQRLQVQVPRGPLGLRIAATQGPPDAS